MIKIWKESKGVVAMAAFVALVGVFCFVKGREDMRDQVWANLTNNTEVVLIHSDGKLVTSIEQLGPEWPNIRWSVWSTNTQDSVNSTAIDAVRQWLKDTQFESNQTRTIKIITHDK